MKQASVEILKVFFPSRLFRRYPSHHAVEIDADTKFQQGVPEALQFGDADASHQEYVMKAAISLSL